MMLNLRVREGNRRPVGPELISPSPVLFCMPKALYDSYCGLMELRDKTKQALAKEVSCQKE